MHSCAGGDVNDDDDIGGFYEHTHRVSQFYSIEFTLYTYTCVPYMMYRK